MKKAKSIFNNLNLLYYEYDDAQNKFIKDARYNKTATFDEFIKLTYELSKSGIKFFIDKNSDIVLLKEDGFLFKLKHRVKNITNNLRHKRKDIYVLSDTYVQHAKNLPLIRTDTVRTDFDIEKYEALIFTSKNGVIHLDEITDKWKDIPSYAISTQTAKEIKGMGGGLEFIGKEKHGNEFAKELVSLLKGKKVAYIGAKKVVSDLNDILNSNGVECDHIAVYETRCVEYERKLDLPKRSIIIFSSPSTIECFFKNVKWKDSFKAISIGKTTAQHFPKDIKPIMADNTTLQSCVQKALNL